MSEPDVPEAPRGEGDVGALPGMAADRPSPRERIARAALSLVLLYLVFGLLIPSFASYEDVWAALTSLGAQDVVLLTLLTVLLESCKAGANSLVIEPLRFPDAFLAQESAAVVSNTVPGPSGTAARYATYRKLGISNEDFATSYVVNNAISYGIPLVLPVIGLLLLSTQADVPGAVWTLALIGLAVSAVALALLLRILRSEPFARRFGTALGRLLNWLRGVVHKPPGEDLGETFVGWREEVVGVFRRRWAGLVAIYVTREVATYLVLLVSLRALGVERDVLTAVEVFAVFTVVRLATLVEITPGNVGISEALYIAALDWAAGGLESDAIVAAVFVFRMFTYLGPILLGAGCSVVLARKFRRGVTPSAA